MTRADKLEELFETVRAMRKSQKKYFATRDAFALSESKQLEVMVDRLLLAIDNKQESFEWRK